LSLSRYTDALHVIAERLGLQMLRATAARPGVNEALRVTIRYSDGKLPDSVATLERGVGDNCRLHVIYDRYNGQGEPYRYEFAISLERYHKLLAALRLSRFEALDDAFDTPPSGVDVWLVERAAGSYFHDVILSPGNATAHHREVVVTMKTHLPEAVRALAV
jgi:hypothetical protein